MVQKRPPALRQIKARGRSAAQSLSVHSRQESPMSPPEMAYMGLILMVFLSFSSCLAWVTSR